MGRTAMSAITGAGAETIQSVFYSVNYSATRRAIVAHADVPYLQAHQEENDTDCR